MTDHSLQVIPVMERGTNRFLGSVTCQDVLDMVVLMHQIDGEEQRRANPLPDLASPNAGRSTPGEQQP